MKTKTFFLHLMSVVVLSVFIAFCIGCFNPELAVDALFATWELDSERMEDGTKVESQVVSSRKGTATITETGKTDKKGRWDGPFSKKGTIAYNNPPKVQNIVHSATMVHGKRHGMWIKTTTTIDPPNVEVDTTCFHEDEEIDCDSLDRNRTTDTTAYDILVNRYRLHYYDLKEFLFNEDAFIKSYMDTLANIIGSYDVDINMFDEYYDDALDELESTAYDSLTRDNNDLTIFRLMDLVRNDRFRLAVFDRYLKDLNSTFEAISDFYPGYLDLMEAFEVSNSDFEKYCQVYDSVLNLYTPLDIEHFSFPDSMDARMYRAFNAIDSLYSDGLIGDVVSGRLKIPNDIFHSFESFMTNRGIISDINSSVVLLSLAEYIYQADIIRLCQRETYYLQNEFVDYPTVTTTLKEQNSNTEARIQGFVAYDGGAEVTKRGIFWGQHYNPTMDDNQENGGSGTGLFSVTLTNLTPGETYYARSFAANSAGTSYGNCVEFIAQQVTGIDEVSSHTSQVRLFPNPANAFIEIVCDNGDQEIDHLFISDVRGNKVLTKSENGIIKKQLTLDVSNLPDGIYLCQIIYADGNIAVKKFTIVH